MRRLFTGGVRSGKSARAQAVAEACGPRRLYLATAEALDDEMTARIARHQSERGAGWSTVEAPLQLAAALRQHAADHDVVLIDCLTLWTSNLLGAELDDAAIAAAVDELVLALHDCPVPVILVTNEVGLGLVPPSALGRRYRDALGLANQRVAAACDHVVLLVAGLPLVLKGTAS